MIIQVDQEGFNAITTICRIALRAADLQALQPVNVVLGNLKPIEETKTDGPRTVKIHQHAPETVGTDNNC
jgi:hypothetical protein